MDKTSRAEGQWHLEFKEILFKTTGVNRSKQSGSGLFLSRRLFFLFPAVKKPKKKINSPNEKFQNHLVFRRSRVRIALH